MRIAICLVMAGLLCGCSSTKWKGENGQSFESKNFLVKRQLKEAHLATNVWVRGYKARGEAESIAPLIQGLVDLATIRAVPAPSPAPPQVIVVTQVVEKIVVPDPEEPVTPPSEPFLLDRVDEWRHTDVSRWEETARLSAALTGEHMTLDYDKANVWPAKNPIGESDLVGNAWIAWQEDGKWIASTWEWLRPGQTVKQIRNIKGMNIPAGTVYVWVSGLARNATRNVEERSNVVALEWK